MGDYRAYILEVDDQRFVIVEDFLRNYRDDDAAIQAAKKLTDKHVVEVWDCGRLVAELSPAGNVMSPELAPSLVFASPANSDKKSAPSEAFHLSNAS
jgi:hypothetical protein